MNMCTKKGRFFFPFNPQNNPPPPPTQLSVRNFRDVNIFFLLIYHRRHQCYEGAIAQQHRVGGAALPLITALLVLACLYTLWSCCSTPLVVLHLLNAALVSSPPSDWMLVEEFLQTPRKYYVGCLP